MKYHVKTHGMSARNEVYDTINMTLCMWPKQQQADLRPPTQNKGTDTVTVQQIIEINNAPFCGDGWH